MPQTIKPQDRRFPSVFGIPQPHFLGNLSRILGGELSPMPTNPSSLPLMVALKSPIWHLWHSSLEHPTHVTLQPHSPVCWTQALLPSLLTSPLPMLLPSSPSTLFIPIFHRLSIWRNKAHCHPSDTSLVPVPLIDTYPISTASKRSWSELRTKSILWCLMCQGPSMSLHWSHLGFRVAQTQGYTWGYIWALSELQFSYL